ncbi:folate transporter 1, chloroplastic isoform X2 [Amborella trichopoda]|uniref:folate transporter 1, chloroplastic isoform X2 n=1 Tax=Amborella trichopoda TaxID=13333 RepID=UPI0009BDCB8C|nr:folate transporter 1, chloroplastic isoform X2 [Amborella trichopoda]|eukprot:XP_020530089.1 folate transporter 1, chloroplastic isoform X2 [Amborella trichopoda]
MVAVERKGSRKEEEEEEDEDKAGQSAWGWENATAGAIAGFATVAALHPLDVVRTRFQVNDGRCSTVPSYKNTAHALFTIARSEACLFTNPVWLVKTRLQLQTPLSQSPPYSGFSDAIRTILKEEGWRTLYKGIGPGLLLVSHGAIQFTAYEEACKILIKIKSTREKHDHSNDDRLLNSVDYAVLGASSKIVAILLTYPFQVIRSRLQQRPSTHTLPRYRDAWHVLKETARFEGINGFYRGITSNLLKNIPAASITFVVYENVLRLLRMTNKNVNN